MCLPLPSNVLNNKAEHKQSENPGMQHQHLVLYRHLVGNTSGLAQDWWEQGHLRSGLRATQPRHYRTSTCADFWVLATQECEQCAELDLLVAPEHLQSSAPTGNIPWFHELAVLLSRVQHLLLQVSLPLLSMKTWHQASLKRDWGAAAAFQGCTSVRWVCRASVPPLQHRYVLCFSRSCYFNPLWQPQPWQEHPGLSKQICRTAWSW